MSFSEGYGSPSPKDYGELFEYDDSLIIGDGVVGPTKKQRSLATERLSSSRYPSEMSMDLSDLQIEEGSSRLVSGSMLSNNFSNNSSSDGSPRQLQQQQHRIAEKGDDSKKSDDSDGSSGYCSYRSGASGTKSGALKFDEIPEDFFQQNNMSDFTSFYTDSFRQEIQRQSLSTVDEQEDSESENSISSLANLETLSRRGSLQSSNGSVNRRKVKFEISTRLEDIQEYEKPDLEDYGLLYYTSHELQKMIDGQREDNRRERNTVR